MQAEIVDTYSSLTQRLATGFVFHIVTKHQGTLVNPVNQVPATLFVIVAVIAENYIEREISKIATPSLALLRDVLSTIFVFVGSLLAYLLVALIDGFFTDELGSELSITTVYRPILLIVSVSLVITVLKFFAGEIKTRKKKTPDTQD